MSVLLSFSHCAQSVVIFVAIIFVLCHQTCSAKHHRFCPPSSCGKIGNITYPFRLKSDPQGCGLERYGFDLECVNNLTVLSLFSGKYHVQEINYNRYKMRVIDAGVVEDTACSFPRYHLCRFNFSNNRFYDEEFFFPEGDMLTVQNGCAASLVFLNCSDPVTDDPRYVEVNAGGCDSGGHIYAVLDRCHDDLPEFTLMDIKVGCHLKIATLANSTWDRSRKVYPTNWEYDTDDRNISYAYIHKLLGEGFWLSWLPLICKNRCGNKRRGTSCSINQTTQQFACQQQGYCHLVVHDSSNCGPAARILGDTLRYIKFVILGFAKRIQDIKQPLS